MKSNLIILTGGISGSSVLAGLISKAGYWLGDDTKKVAYDTFENSRLVDLNNAILKASGFHWRDIGEIPPPSIRNIMACVENLELDPFQEFIDQCGHHRPWLWKDPRLSFTIYFWKKFVDLENTKFMLMLRDLKQTWTGTILRGKEPIAYKDVATIQNNAKDAAINFFEINHLEYLPLSFEDLILTPDAVITKINNFLGTNLSLNDFLSIYKGTLYKKRWNLMHFYQAHFKFLVLKYIFKAAITYPRSNTLK